MSDGARRDGAQPVHDPREWARDLLVAAALAVAVFAVSRAYALPLVGLHHDDGQYVVAAKALATGAGYRQLHAPGTPPQTKFPVLFPALLAIAWAAAPSLPDAALLMSRACSASLAAAAAVVYLAARRRFRLPAWAAAPLAAAACTLPSLAGLGAQVMSEPLFLLLVALALTYAVAEDASPATWWMAGLALGLAALTRTVGLSIVAGLLAWCAWRRRWPAGLVWPGVVLPAAWLAWSRMTRVAVPGDPLGYATSYEAWLGTVPLASWPIVLRDNALSLFVHGGHLAAQSVLWGLPDSWRPAAALACGLVLVSLVAAGGRRLGGPWTWALAGYVLAVIAWPWPPSRFIVAVLPVALVLPWAAARDQRPLLAAMSVAATVLTATNAAHAAAVWRSARASDALVLPGAAPAPWREYSALFAWIRQATAPDAVVVSVAEPMLYLYAGRRGVFPFEQRTIAINYSSPPSIGSGGDLDALLAAVRATHLVCMPAPAWAHADRLDAVIAALRARAPCRLRPVYRGADPRFEVFEVFAVSQEGSRCE